MTNITCFKLGANCKVKTTKGSDASKDPCVFTDSGDDGSYWTLTGGMYL